MRPTTRGSIVYDIRGENQSAAYKEKKRKKKKQMACAAVWYLFVVD